MSTVQHFTDAQETFAVFDLPNHAVVEFTGGDRARFLHNFCTNDINNLAVNTGCEVIFTNIKARAMGHGFVFAGEESHWLQTVADGLNSLLKHLDKYIITDDVEIKRRDDLKQVLVTGPGTVESVALAVGTTESLGELTQVVVGDVTLRRIDCCGGPAIVIAGTESALQPVIDQLTADGKTIGSFEAYEAVRLAAGFPSYGTDITDDHLAPEVGRVAQTISYRKGCYLGQEPIARIDALGHVNNSLYPVEISGSEPPAAGSVVTGAGGEEAGTVTSSAKDPTADRCFALARLKREASSSESELNLGDRTVTLRGE